jgi:hypothetical protein
MSEETLIIDDQEFGEQLERFALYSGRSFEDELENQGKLLVRDILRLTPPSRFGASVSEAKRAGERSIRKNLRSVFSGVNLKGQRQITHLFGRTDVAGLPFRTPTTEKHPDVKALYEQRKVGSGYRVKRGGRAKYYVDERKLAALEQVLMKRVGWAAAGFGPAAQRLGAAVPAYVRRHVGKAPGTVAVNTTGAILSIVITNRVDYVARLSGLQRRLNWAVARRKTAMEKQLPYLIRRHERLVN